MPAISPKCATLYRCKNAKYMNTAALVTMLLANGVVIAMAGYFFWRILRSGPPDEVDEEKVNFPCGG